MTRYIRPAAVAAAILFAATATVDIPRAQPTVFTGTIDYVLEALFASALWAATIALACLAVRNSRRAARLVIITATLGHACFATAATATLINGREALAPVALVGLVLIMAGYLGFFVVDLIKLVEPRFSGIAMLVATVGMLVLGDGWGLIAWAAGWFAVAAILHERKPSTPIKPSRVLA
jgi:hypothetical protein